MGRAMMDRQGVPAMTSIASLPFLAGALTILLPSLTLGQGITPYDTYRDAFGGPHYTGNLTPAPDDRTVLGPVVALGDPWLIRTRPARGWGELTDTGGGFWEWQADRIRQRHQDVEERDLQYRRRDAALPRHEPFRGSPGFGGEFPTTAGQYGR